MKKVSFLVLVNSLLLISVNAQNTDSLMIRKIYDKALTSDSAYLHLAHLAQEIGSRTLGSEGETEAITWLKNRLQMHNNEGKVYLQKNNDTKWVRSQNNIKVVVIDNKEKIDAPACVLEGSVSIKDSPIVSEVIEIKDLNHLEELKDYIKDKVVFFNYKIDSRIINPFLAYQSAHEQTDKATIAAAKLGANAIVFRSLVSIIDDVPRSEEVVYDPKVVEIPCIAISTKAAEDLGRRLALSKLPAVRILLSQSSDDHESDDEPYETANVIAEIRGAKSSDKAIVICARLNSSDLGQGVVNNGIGVIQAMGSFKLLQELGYVPNHTIRVVLFSGHSNAPKGIVKYLSLVQDFQMSAIECTPRLGPPIGFSFDGVFKADVKMKNTVALLSPYGIYKTEIDSHKGHLMPFKGRRIRDKLVTDETVLITPITNDQRVIDLQNSVLDTFQQTNKRELDLSIATYASLLYILDKE